MPNQSSIDFHCYEPNQGHGLRHDPIAAILGPRFIGWISTRSLDGTPNLAPYSFFGIFNYQPPIIGFSSVGWKDTVRNAQDTGQFVVNLATRALAEPMNLSSAELPSDVSEFQVAQLDAIDAKNVAAPRVAQSPVSLECKVLQIQQLSTLENKKINTWLTLGEVVTVHIAANLLKDGVYDTGAAHPILRAGGSSDYFEITPESLFKMRRPR
ncbi:MAG: flavin reductase family protein [Comamonadaceae bacterium]|nr:flavin reductase family protein [Comamonadaceae bacterium]